MDKQMDKQMDNLDDEGGVSWIWKKKKPVATPVAVPVAVPVAAPLAVQRVAPRGDGVLAELDRYTKSGQIPRGDRPVAFLDDVIRSSYPRDTETYQMSDKVADALREYVRLSKEYKEDLRLLNRRLETLIGILNRNMGIPKRQLRPLVETVIPLAIQDRRFY